jgi:hypothetical protein
MRAHLFRDPGRIFAVTTDSTGLKLPKKYAPWTALKTVELEKDILTPGLDVNECLQDLENYDVHITDAHIHITEDAIR